MTRRQCASTLAVLAVVLGSLAASASRAEERRPTALDQRELAAQVESVELFQAIDDGVIEVKVIPRNDEVARVMITNKTGELVSVELPEAFGLVPAAAQCCAVACCCSNSAQPAGGGMNAGLFNVPAEAVRTIRAPIVCLAHGKRDPRPSIPYVLVKLESVCDARELSMILGFLAKEEVDHAAVQAAAWHLANAMSWQTLAAKEIRHLNGTREPYFSDRQIRTARELTERARRQLAEREERTSPAEGQPLAETTLEAQ